MSNLNKSSSSLIEDGQNVQFLEQQKIVELNKLSPGEPNWYAVFTDLSFVWRLGIIILAMVVCALVILNVTLDPSSKSWFNQLHKPDWMPDGITITLIFAFVSILLAWTWYKLSRVAHWSVNLLFVAIIAIQVVWTLQLYRFRHLEVGRYLACFFLGVMVLLLLVCFYYTRFSDITFYTLLYVGWLVIVVCFTFGLKSLDKEYKILGLVTDKNSSLYKRKMKMEIVQGIKVTEDGQKIEVNPEDQE
jgi:tryptophan-rich sensory protein